MPNSRQQPAVRASLRRLVAESLASLARGWRRPPVDSALRQRWRLALFVFVNSFLTIGLLAGLAMIFHLPLIFPSVGPTAFLFFFMPKAPAAQPRNALCGHAVGILCGYGSLCLLGLAHAPSAMREGVTLARVLAVALSLAATGAVMILLRTVHSPAGATTLIISLGIITKPLHLVIMELAVVLLTLQAIVSHRLVGGKMPMGKGLRGPGTTTRRAAQNPQEFPCHDQAQARL